MCSRHLPRSPQTSSWPTTCCLRSSLAGGHGAAGISTVYVLRSDDAWYRNLTDSFVSGEDAFRVEGVVAVSHELAGDVQSALAARTEFMQCPSSVPIPRDTASWQRGRFHAVSLGRLDQKQKRILDLARALIATSRAHPYFSATIYGDGPARQELTHTLQRESGHRVSYGGILATDDVYPRLLEAQAFVQLSAYEGLSTSVQEAMACGLPPIVRRTRSELEGAVIADETGLVIDEDHQLTTAVARLASSREEWQRLSDAARKLAAQEFDIKRAARQWRSFLDQLALAPGRGSLRVPSAEELERVFALYLENRDRLQPFEVDWLLSKGRPPGRGFLADLRNAGESWEQRRRRLYRALE